MAVPGHATEKPFKIKGIQALPYISQDGQPDLVYLDAHGRMKLSTRDQSYSFGNGQIRSIKSDSRTRLWLVWETAGLHSSEVFLGISDSGRLVKRYQVSRGIKGSHHSPDLDLDARDRPWIVWINSRDSRHRLLVAEGPSGSVCSLGNFTDPVFAPRIVLDRLGRPWVFWVGPGPEFDTVLFSVREGGHWSEPAPLGPTTAGPAIHPSVAINEMGYPTAVWSAFDGEDYEVYFSSFNGQDWSQSLQITLNSKLGDAQPALVYLQGVTPVLAWTQAGAEGNSILLTSRSGGIWHTPQAMTPPSSRNRSPRLASRAHHLALSWSENGQAFIKKVNLNAPPAVFDPIPDKILQIQSPHLEASTFIAFGDSITYGSMNGPFQGKGYPPRLQELLDDDFQDPVVLNCGIPGETTWEAVSRIHSVINTNLGLFLLLMEGTNDVSTLSYSMETTAFNLRQILNTSLDAGMFPLISTIIPRAGSRWTAIYQQRTNDLNSRIAALATEIHVMPVNNYSAFISFPAESGGHEALISSDDLHPNDLGYQVMAETWNQTIGAIPYPPVQIEAKKSERSGSIQLTWEEDPRISNKSNIKNYRIYRKNLASKVLSVIALVGASVRSFNDINISVENEYLYVISALNTEDIEGPMSDPVFPVKVEPFAPINIQVDTEVNRSFLYAEYINRITWQDNPDNQGEFVIASHRIYRKLSGQTDDRFVLLGEVSAGQREYLDRGLSDQDAAGNFEYGVTTVDSEGNESPLGKTLAAQQTVFTGPQFLRAGSLRK